ncbi:MAG: ECF transporter S component [Lachnospiraceae bacterium]
MDQKKQNRKKTQRESSQEKTRKLTLSAMFFALGIVLPFWIGQIPAIGKVLLPMHIPVLLCGLIVGWKYGLAPFFCFLSCEERFLACRNCSQMEWRWQWNSERMDS